MKPFDLQKALAGEPVVTKNGQSVSQLTLFSLTKDDYCIYGVIEGRIQRWTLIGQYDFNHKNHDLDLFIGEREQWVNIHFNAKPQRFFGGLIYESEADALKDKDKMPNYQATIKVKDSTKEK
jgi:hypothetical protein